MTLNESDKALVRVRRLGSRTVVVTQKLADFGVKLDAHGKLVHHDGSRIKHNYAFKDWQHRLKRGERLPRGRFFRGKKPGRPLVVIDEMHKVWGRLPPLRDTENLA
ncbi:hypothetical protein [Erwinia mallotivora]|uniref:hypothetical protein n=1 Tax=Erwinia mallotivora TaxID=69222 RepID=UPI0021C0F012|nr:hypothetical protein [Erwinia mallotivora]